MGFYEDIRDNDVAPLLAELGASTTLTVNNFVFDPVTGANTTSTAAYYTGSCIVTDYTTREIDGTVVQRDDKKVLLALDDVTITPKAGDKLDDYIIQNVNSLAPSGVNVLWTLQVRK